MTLSDVDQIYRTVRDTFCYDPTSGLLVRVVNKSKYDRSATGHKVIRKSGKAYIQVKVGRKTYLAHRIIYLYVTGRFPEGEIDHRDGDGTNNRWDNLTVGTRRDNCLNVRRRADNRSGVTGVSFCKGKQKWQAYISSDAGRIHLGFFEVLEDAAAARKKAAETFGYKDGHGSNRPL